MAMKHNASVFSPFFTKDSCKLKFCGRVDGVVVIMLWLCPVVGAVLMDI